MSDETEKLLPTLLSLPEGERVALADRLYESVGEDDPGLMAELDRRLADHESGRDPGTPAEEFFRRLREKRS